MIAVTNLTSMRVWAEKNLNHNCALNMSGAAVWVICLPQITLTILFVSKKFGQFTAGENGFSSIPCNSLQPGSLAPRHFFRL
jgi:hypothetical protein